MFKTVFTNSAEQRSEKLHNTGTTSQSVKVSAHDSTVRSVASRKSLFSNNNMAAQLRFAKSHLNKLE